MDISLTRRRDLRRLSTEAEIRLWRMLRGRRLWGMKFRRQHPIGPYILDLYCAPRRLAVELDGGQHFTEEEQAHDARRSAFLAAQGIRVVRFTNREVFEELDGVLEVLRRAVGG